MARSRASAKAAGSRFERVIADYFRDNYDDRIDRRVKTGAADKGDIANVRMAAGGRVVVECKDTARPSLGPWVKEAEAERINDKAGVGVVIHKRTGVSAPGQQFVTMTVDNFIALLKGATQ